MCTSCTFECPSCVDLKLRNSAWAGIVCVQHHRKHGQACLPCSIWSGYEAHSKAHKLASALQSAGLQAAVLSGDVRRARFAVRGHAAMSSWDVYWTSRRVSTAL